MSKKNKKTWKWIIRTVIFVLIPSMIFAVLYFTNNIDPLLSKLCNEVNSWTVVSIVIVVLLYIFGKLFDRISNYVLDLIFPDKKSETKRLESKIDKVLENLRIDPRIIKRRLKDLESLSTLVKKNAQIKKWYENNIIDSTLKDILIVIVEYRDEAILALEEKIKIESNSVYKKALENLKLFLENGDAEKIKNNYFNFIEQQNEENIEFLRISIDSSKQLFAFDETIDLYQELIKIKPTAENFFNFGVYLQKLNYFDKSLEKYEEALTIYRELAEENPRTYLPYVATTLNNLANLHTKKNEFPQALEKYEEALTIRRELAEENPRVNLPDVATTLNNLANLHSKNNDFPQALEKYEEALTIYRKLAKENPRAYGIDYAMLLIMGVDLFHKNKTTLKEARNTLNQFQDIYLAKQLLKMIDDLENLDSTC